MRCHRTLTLTALLALGACSPEGDADDPGDTGDTDVRADVGPLTLGLSTDVDRDDLVVAAAVPDVDRLVATAPVRDGEATLEIPVPGEGVAVAVRGEEGARAASYLLVTFLDEDGDGEKDDAEVYVGTSAFTLSLEYVEGATDAMRAAGRVDGWTLVDTDDSSLDPEALEVPADFLPVETLRLGGTNDHPHPDARLAVVSPQLESQLDPLVDIALDGPTWTLELTGRPPASHEMPEFTSMVPESLVVYVDDNAPAGPWGDIEEDPLFVCINGGPVVAAWSLGPTGLDEAQLATRYAMTFGWDVWDVVDDDVVDPSDRTRLAIGPDACDF